MLPLLGAGLTTSRMVAIGHRGRQRRRLGVWPRRPRYYDYSQAGPPGPMPMESSMERSVERPPAPDRSNNNALEKLGYHDNWVAALAPQRDGEGASKRCGAKPRLN